MTLKIIGRQLDIGDALRTQIQDRMDAAFKKYFDGGFSGHVTLSKQSNTFSSECVLHLDSGMILQASGKAGDGYSAFAEAAEHLEKRLRRYKRRLKDRKSEKDRFKKADISAMNYVLEAPNDTLEEAEEAFSPVIVAESPAELPVMSVGEAVVEMDLTGVPVFVFKNAAQERLNIVYQRPDGHVGWIDPTSN